MDLESLLTELQIRGFDQAKIDSALRCLVHVYSVQDFTCAETGGVLVQDIVSSYPIEVVQAASELYFDKHRVFGQDVYSVKWGFDTATQQLEKQLWENSSERWQEFIAQVDERYLGFFLPLSYEDARVVTFWKTRKDLKWFGMEAPGHGWNILRMIDDLVEVSWKLDLAFGFRRFGPNGIEGERTLIHKKAFDVLKERAVVSPDVYRTGIKLWKFFSEYDAESSDIVELMKECGVSLDEVQAQVKVFYKKGLTTPYREGQYPPYLVIEKTKKQYQEAVRELLNPMDAWLSRRDSGQTPVAIPMTTGEPSRLETKDKKAEQQVR